MSGKKKSWRHDEHITSAVYIATLKVLKYV